MFNQEEYRELIKSLYESFFEEADPIIEDIVKLNEFVISKVFQELELRINKLYPTGKEDYLRKIVILEGIDTSVADGKEDLLALSKIEKILDEVFPIKGENFYHKFIIIKKQ